MADGGRGLIAGGLLGMVLAVVARVGDWQVLRWVVLGCVVVVPLAALAVATMAKADPLQAVRAIDAHYDLKSRTITLWSFFQSGPLNEARRLAVDEAWGQVKRTDPAQVVPVSVPKSIYAGVALAGLAVVLAFVPLPGFTSDAPPPDEKPPLSVAGEAELAALAELTEVDASLAERSLRETRRVASGNPAPETPQQPTGNDEIAAHYFKASATP